MLTGGGRGSRALSLALLLVVCGCVVVCVAAPPRMVFCHYMLWVPGISDSVDGFAQEMRMAKSYGIDAWAVNTAQWYSDTWPQQRMQKMRQAAEQTGFKFFMSADMTVEFINSPGAIVDMISTLAQSSAYLRVNNSVFLSTFVGQSVGWDWQSSVLTPLSKKGYNAYFVPFFDGDPTSIANRFPYASGFFHWTAWPYASNLQDVDASFDRTWKSVTQSRGKAFMAPVSPYFVKHYCGLPSDAKPNWVFGNYKGPGLWIDHWHQLIDIGPEFIEIVTWNDYPEGSYIGPVTAPWGLTGNCNNGPNLMYDRNGFPHDAYADLGAFFINAYKHYGDYSYTTKDSVYAFYRPFSKNINCPDPTGLGPIQNGNSMDDVIYIITLFNSPATIQINSGGTSKQFSVTSGLSTSAMSFSTGDQSVTVFRNNQQVAYKKFAKQITTQCTDGKLYDMNTYSEFFKF